MINSLSFINKFFWKNILNMFFAFILPFILVLLATVGFTVSVDISNITDGGINVGNTTFLSPVYVIPGTAALSIVCLTCLSLPLLVYNFRKADVLKRIMIRINNSWSFYAMVGLFYLVISSLSYVFSYFFSAAIIISILPDNAHYVAYMLIHANYGNFLFALMSYVVLGITMGLVIATFLNSIISIQIAGATLALFAIFLGGAGIPLQYIAMYSQTNGEFRSFSLWQATYFSPFRFPQMLLLESLTQGPAFNAGSLTQSEWSTLMDKIITSPGTYDLKFYESLGYSSIFNFNHPFTTNLVPIPYYSYVSAAGARFDMWDVSKCSGYFGIWFYNLPMQQAPALIWSIYWQGIDISKIFTLPPEFPMHQIPVFTFSGVTDKILDVFFPMLLSGVLGTLAVLFYKKKSFGGI